MTHVLRTALQCVLLACGGRTELGSAVGSEDASAKDVGAQDVRGADTWSPDAGTQVCGSAASPLQYLIYKPDQIVVDDTYVYVHSLLGLNHFTKGGKTTASALGTAAAFSPQLDAFVVINANYFFAVNSENFVDECLVAGGLSSTVDTSIPAAGLALSTTRVYAWPQIGGPTAIDRFDFDGGSLEHAVATLPAPPAKMVFDGNVGYAATVTGVYAVDVIDGGVTVVSSLAATDITVDSANVYFTNPSVGLVVVSVTTLATNILPDTVGAFAVVLDATDAYVTDGIGRRVRRIIGKQGAIVDLASVGPAYTPVDVALDDHCLYWTNDGSPAGAIMTMAKPK